MTPGVAHPSEANESKRGEILLYLLTFAAIAVVMQPVFLHPGEVIYSPTSDVFSGHHPYRVLQLRALAEWGTTTLWDPTAFGGMPLVSDPQAGLFYPPNWLQVLYPGAEALGWYGWLIVLHLVIGAWGMLWWLRGHGFSRAARFIAAVAFVLCGKWLFHVLTKGHIGFLPLMWMPWQLGLIDALDLRPTPRRAALLAVCLALMITGTHPQLLLYGLLLTISYGLLVAGSHAAREGQIQLRSLAMTTVSGLLTLGLAAVFLLPIIDGLDEFVRGEGFGYADAARRSLKPAQLAGFLVPTLLPPERSPELFAGVLGLALALFAFGDRRRRQTVCFFWLMIVLIVWYALGDGFGLHRFLYDYAPGFRLFRIPNRALLMLGLPIGYLGAAGAGVLCEQPPSPRKRAFAALSLIAGVAMLAGLRSADAVLAAAAFAVPAICVLPWSPRARTRLAYIVAAAVLLDQARFVGPLVETRPALHALGTNPVAERLAAPLGEARVLAFNERRAGDASSLPVTYTTRAGIESLRGLNPLVPRATALYLYTGAARSEMREARSTTITTFPIESRAHLDLFNVRWVVTNHPLAVQGLVLREVFRDLDLYHFQAPWDLVAIPETYLYENERVFPRAALVRGARAVSGVEEAIAAIGQLDPTRLVLLEEADAVATYPGPFSALEVDHRGDRLELEIDAGDGGYLVLSEVWYPGWHAEDNGSPAEILRANGIFRALRLEPGSHHIRMWYQPRAFTLGRWISAASILVALGCLRFD